MDRLEMETLKKAATGADQQGKLMLFESRRKNPGLAVVFSLLFLGGGQFYLGRTGRGVAVLIGGMILIVITFGLGALLVLPLAMIDAYRLAKKHNTTIYNTLFPEGEKA